MNKKAKKKLNKANGFKNEIFKVGDIVGAKVKGYPYWPGHIEKIDYINKKCKYTVKFFYTNDSSPSCMSIKPFADFTEQERACKKKGFQEAFAMCLEKYNSLEKISAQDEEQEVDRSPACQSTTPSSIQDEPNLVIKEEPIELPQKKDNVSRRKKVPIAPKSSPRKSRQLQKQTTLTEIPKLEIESDVKQPTSPKSEGENVVQAAPDVKTIAKLREKVNKKIEEKKACKTKKKEEKLSKYISEKLARINKNLERFLKVLEDMLNTKSPDNIKINKWNESVQTYNSVINVLGKCIQNCVKSPRQISDSNECRKCYEHLDELVSKTKTGMKSSNLPHDIKLDQILSRIKKEPDVKDFLNNYDSLFGSTKSAMLERKENDAE